MPDPRKTAPPPRIPSTSRARVESVAAAEPVAAALPPGSDGDRLAELNDHLGRFLGHADQLLDEWSRFAAQVRTTVDEQTAVLDQTIAASVERAAERAGERAARELATRLDASVAERVDRTLGDGVARLRVELDRLAGTARGVAPQRRRDLGAPTLIAVVVGNLLLAALLALGARDCAARAPAAAPPILDAAPATDPAVTQACAALVAGWSEPAAAIVIRAGAAACGPAADTVAERLAATWAAPVDAGVPDAGPAGPAGSTGPIDAAPRPAPHAAPHRPAKSK